MDESHGTCKKRFDAQILIPLKKIEDHIEIC